MAAPRAGGLFDKFLNIFTGARGVAAIYVFLLPAGEFERYGAPALLPG